MKILILTKIEFKNKIKKIFKKQKIEFDFCFCSEKKNNYKSKKNLFLGKKIKNRDFIFIKNKKYDFIITVLWPYLLKKQFYKIPDEPIVYDYLLRMPFYSLTKEKVEELNKLHAKKKQEFDELNKKSPSQLWLDDLDNLSSLL